MKKTIIPLLIAYVADEYDDFRSTINDANLLIHDLTCLKQSLNQILSRQNSTETKINQLEQYRRRKNLEIHEVPPQENKNTNEIMKSIAKYLNISLDDSQISISHRLQSPKTLTTNKNQNQSTADGNKYAPIKVGLNRM